MGFQIYILLMLPMMIISFLYMCWAIAKKRRANEKAKEQELVQIAFNRQAAKQTTPPQPPTGQSAHTQPVHTMKTREQREREAAETAAKQPTPEKREGKVQQSTTEMLSQKAKLDASAHQKEKRRQELENQKTYGQLHLAQRLLLGDAVPRGMRRLCCKYCGADNLISISEQAGKYNCYFCREKL